MTTPSPEKLRMFGSMYVLVGFVFGIAAIARGFEIAHGDWHACPAGAPVSRCIANWRTLPSLYVCLGIVIIAVSTWSLYAIRRRTARMK